MTENGQDKDYAQVIKGRPPVRYRADVDFHLPADPGWRELPQHLKNVCEAGEPEGLVQELLKTVIRRLNLSGDVVFVGVLLNIINQFPDNVRETIALGIVEGVGLSLAVKPTGVEGTMHQRFSSLPVKGEKRTASGLIVPGQAGQVEEGGTP